MMIFSNIAQAPADIILGLNESFKADERSTKVNLGIGVYADDDGKLPVMKAVQAAIDQQNSFARPYVPIDGVAAYTQGVKKLLFKNTDLLTQNRVVTAQTLGGTGALKVGADFLFHQIFNRDSAQAKVVVSNPSWENHKVIFAQAGFSTGEYDYYDPITKGVNVQAMLASLEKLSPKTVCVFHVCCHNPTGADLSHADWQKVVNVCVEKQLIPFLDMAYQGFSEGVEKDAAAIDLFAKSGLAFFVSSSFSKSFSLYGERVGALSIVTEDAAQTPKVLSQVKALIRGNYSNPPTTGAQAVGLILNDSTLYQMWVDELESMRVRIDQMRQLFTNGLAQMGDFSFILKQRGMFSYSGLSAAQVERLRLEFGVYAIPTGRICVAALNTKNIEHTLSSIQKVL
jgi:aromatic-amino-acid transaminase